MEIAFTPAARHAVELLATPLSSVGKFASLVPAALSRRQRVPQLKGLFVVRINKSVRALVTVRDATHVIVHAVYQHGELSLREDVSEFVQEVSTALQKPMLLEEAKALLSLAESASANEDPKRLIAAANLAAPTLMQQIRGLVQPKDASGLWAIVGVIMMLVSMALPQKERPPTVIVNVTTSVTITAASSSSPVIKQSHGTGPTPPAAKPEDLSGKRRPRSRGQ